MAAYFLEANMSRIHLEQDIKPLSEFRANAAAAIRHIRKTKRAMVLTRRGYSTAVVLDVTAYEQLLEELDRLRSLTRVRDSVQQATSEEPDPRTN